MIDLSAYGTETLKNAACIYKNPLQRLEDIRDFVQEGKAVFSFPNARLRMENQLDAASFPDMSWRRRTSISWRTVRTSSARPDCRRA